MRKYGCEKFTQQLEHNKALINGSYYCNLRIWTEMIHAHTNVKISIHCLNKQFFHRKTMCHFIILVPWAVFGFKHVSYTKKTWENHHIFIQACELSYSLLLVPICSYPDNSPGPQTLPFLISLTRRHVLFFLKLMGECGQRGVLRKNFNL